MSTDEFHAAFAGERAEDAALAVSAAFALVAFADGVLTHEESARYWQEATSRHALTGAPLDHLETYFVEAARKLSDDYAGAKPGLLDCIRAVRGDLVARGAVVGFARIALAADGKLRAQEEAMLAEIAEALSLDPKTI